MKKFTDVIAYLKQDQIIELINGLDKFEYGELIELLEKRLVILNRLINH